MKFTDLVTDIQTMRTHFLPYKVGDRVVYREQKGTVVKIETETYIIHLDNGFERWLTADDLRKL